jgi:hypothetical protein
MPVLELEIRANTGPGAAQATRDIQAVGAAAEKTAAAMTRTGASLSGAFQAANGSVQIAQGITQTATAFNQLNTTAGVFSLARVILEVGNTARDMGELRRASGGAATAIGLIGTAIRANPIGALATAIGLAATAMTLFGNNTKKVVVDWKELSASIAEATRTASTMRGLGAGSEVALGRDRMRAIETAYPYDKPVTLNRLQEVTGGTRMDVLRALSRAGDYNAQRYMRTGTIPSLGEEQTFMMWPEQKDRIPGVEPTEGDFRRWTVRPDLARDVYRTAYQSYRDQESRNLRWQREAYQFGANPPPALFEDGPTNWMGTRPQGAYATSGGLPQRTYVEQGAAGQAEAAIAQTIAMSEKMAENMERAAQAGADIGDTLGDAAAQMLLAGTSLREIVRGIVAQGVQNGLRAAGSAIFSALGKTAGQASQVGGRRVGEGPAPDLPVGSSGP